MLTAGSRRWWALGALTFGVLALGIDATALNVALPTLARDLGASESELQWFVSSYTLTQPATLLPAGLLGDRFGHKRWLLLGLLAFGVGSIATAYAPSPGAFIASRVVLGIGAGLTLPLTLSVIAGLFAGPERARAVGIVAGRTFIALPIGPIFGGWILTNYWWGWIFLMNIPVVVVGLLAVAAFVPAARSAERRGLDPLGVLASSSGLALLIYGFIEAGRYGWGDGGVLTAMAAGGLVLAAFVAWEAWLGRPPGGQPLVNLRLFRSPSFTWGAILSGVASFALFGALFVGPQYFQAILGTDAMGAGLRLIPMVAALAVGAGLADRIAARAGAKLTVTLGFAIMAAGFAVLTTMSLASGDLFLATWLIVPGLGTGMAVATSISSAIATLPSEGAGVGSAVQQVFQRLAPPFAAAVLGSVVHDTYRTSLDPAGLPAQAAELARSSVFAGLQVGQQAGSPALIDSVRASFVSGMDAAFVVGGGVAVVGAALALAFLPQRAMVAQRPSVAVETKLHRGLADGVRLAILLDLRNGQRTTAQIAESVGVSASEASDRLRCLADCGLAEVVAGGPETAYRLADPSVRRLLDASARALERVAPQVEACANYQPSAALSRQAGQA